MQKVETNGGRLTTNILCIVTDLKLFSWFSKCSAGLQPEYSVELTIGWNIWPSPLSKHTNFSLKLFCFKRKECVIWIASKASYSNATIVVSEYLISLVSHASLGGIRICQQLLTFGVTTVEMCWERCSDGARCKN